MLTPPHVGHFNDLYQNVRNTCASEALLFEIIAGLIILLVNIPLVLIIILLPQFRVRKEFLFIAGLAVGDLIYTVGYMMSSIRRIFVIDSSFGGKSQQVPCLLFSVYRIFTLGCAQGLC